jgi:hypothetical protein
MEGNVERRGCKGMIEYLTYSVEQEGAHMHEQVPRKKDGTAAVASVIEGTDIFASRLEKAISSCPANPLLQTQIPFLYDIEGLNVASLTLILASVRKGRYIFLHCDH